MRLLETCPCICYASDELRNHQTELLHERDMAQIIRFSPRPNRAHEIGWFEWGPAAFQKAQSEDKPILLSISAVWCHWCHVMDETSFSTPNAINAINQGFVPIRVDSDQRPDINSRYNMGGWPTIAFLTPLGDLITGATYMAPDELGAALTRVSQAYKEQKDSLLRRSQELNTNHAERTTPAWSGLQIDDSVMATVSRQVVESYDSEYGGFGSQPKFPMVSALELLLNIYQSSCEDSYRHVVEKTLDAMMNGGLYDHEEEGFFRYSTTRDWSVPHFEKMLEDNVRLLRLYLHGSLVTGNDAYAKVATQTIFYVNSSLYDPTACAFYGSQDADKEYYELSLAQRRQSKPPLVDGVLYTGLNAISSSVYFQAAWVLHRPELRSIALETLDFFLRKCESEPLKHSYTDDGVLGIPALLADYANMVIALIDAYEETYEQHYLEEGERLATEMIDIFWDQEHVGFFDIPASPESLGSLKVRKKTLGDNALAAEALISLFNATLKDAYREKAKAALDAFVDVYKEYGEAAAGYALATRSFLHAPIEVTIVGKPETAQTKSLLTSASTIPYPHMELRFLDSADTERLQQAGYWATDEAQAYVCLNTVCLAPMSDPNTLHQAVLDLIAPDTQEIGDVLRTL